MSSSRAIREGTVAELTAAGIPAHECRITHVQHGETRPVVVVDTPSQHDDLDGGALVASSTVELTITIYANGASDLEAFNALDTLEDAVKGVLFTSPGWLGLFDQAKSLTIQRGGDDSAGGRDVVSQITLNLLVTEQYEFDDSTADDLNAVLIHAEVGGNDTPDIDREVDTSGAP